jgi:hypothetical protein
MLRFAFLLLSQFAMLPFRYLSSNVLIQTDKKGEMKIGKLAMGGLAQEMKLARGSITGVFKGCN